MFPFARASRCGVSRFLTHSHMGMSFNYKPFGGHHSGGELCPPITFEGFPTRIHCRMAVRQKMGTQNALVNGAKD